MGDLAKVPVYSIGEMNWNGRTHGMKWDSWLGLEEIRDSGDFLDKTPNSY